MKRAGGKYVVNKINGLSDVGSNHTQTNTLMPPTEYSPTVRLEICNGRSALASRTALPAPFASFADRCTSVSDKKYFPYESQCGRREPRRRHARACPRRVCWPLCAWTIRATIRGARPYGLSLPSLGPQEECPWRLSDVIPARMVSHTLR